MRIADSTVNMLSGRSYTQTGMKNGIAGYESGFMGMINRYSSNRDNALTKDTYQPFRTILWLRYLRDLHLLG